MDRVLPTVWRYRWELAPFVAVAVAQLVGRLAATAFVDPQIVRAVIGLAAAVLLVAMLPRVRREGRPLLTALWVLVVVAEALSAARLLGASLLMGQPGPGGAAQQIGRIGFWMSIAGLASALVIVIIAASQARRSMCFALLLGSTYLAPTYFLGFADFLLALLGFGRPAGMPVIIGMLPWTALDAPFALAAVALIAHTVHHAGTLTPRSVYRRVAVLLVLAGVSMWAQAVAPLVIGAIQAGEWLVPLAPLFVGPLWGIAYGAVFLGLVWGVGRLIIALRPKVASG